MPGGVRGGADATGLRRSGCRGTGHGTCTEQNDEVGNARKRAYCLKICSTRGKLALNLIYSTKLKYARKSLLTMVMGGTGVVSRLSGELMGSVIAFGMAGKPSELGEIDVHQLHRVLNMVHQNSAS